MKESETLTAKEVSELLNLPLVKIQRWVHQGLIPCKFKAQSCLFRREDIQTWAEEHHIPLPVRTEAEAPPEASLLSLRESISQGGFHFDLEGQDIYGAFENAVARLPFEPDKKKLIFDELLDREEIASTGIGKGVAIPHPRHVLDLGLVSPMIPVFFLQQPIEFNAVDNKPVSVLFIMFSPGTKTHLELLARLSFCLRAPEFSAALMTPGDGKSVLEFIRRKESQFKRD